MQLYLIGMLSGILFCVIVNLVILLLKRIERAEKTPDSGQKRSSIVFSEEELEMNKSPVINQISDNNVEQRESRNVGFLAPKAEILLVDDSRLSRHMIAEMLKPTRVAIEEAENGLSCIEKVKRKHYDLILLDQMMPGMDGPETMRRLKGTGVCGGIPVIAIGANIREYGKEQWNELGFCGALSKPIRFSALCDLFTELLPPEKIISVPEGFSFENGLKHFDENEKAYRETLVLFSDLWTEREDTLKQLLERKDMQNYAILIHGIKGDARTLGADILAKMAYEQEIAAKAGNIEAVRTSMLRVLQTGKKTADYFNTMGISNQ